MSQLVLPESFWPREFSEWSRLWNRHDTVEDLSIIARRGSFLPPALVVALASGIAARQEAQRATSLAFEGPNSACARYLQRMDFFRALSRAPASSHGQSGSESFVELERISTLAVARLLAEKTVDVLEAQLGGSSSSALRAARFIFEELAANIVQHSKRSNTGFGMAQTYGARNGLQLAFSDRGVGFLTSLQQNPELAGRLQDDAASLEFALEGNGSSRGRGNLGIGLSFLRDFCDRVGGEMWIASGEALLQRSGRSNRLTPIERWQGAWVCLEFELEAA